jgi:hypothetical protein
MRGILAIVRNPCLPCRIKERRICRPYLTPSFGYFIPGNKSIEDTSLVAVCCEADPFTWGIEDIDLGKGPIRLYCENYHAPYGKAGAVRRRVISVLVPAPLQGSHPTVSSPRQMEIL